jgi:hypothetical protein
VADTDVDTDTGTGTGTDTGTGEKWVLEEGHSGAEDPWMYLRLRGGLEIRQLMGYLSAGLESNMG